MPRFRGEIDVLELNVEEYDRQLKEALFSLFERAATEFVKTAIKRVAVMTGMSMGSFLGIATQLGISLDFSSGATEEQLKKNKWYYGRGGRIPKTPESGESLTTFELSFENGHPVFIFDAKTLQYGLQEFAAGRPSVQIPPPWQSLIYGRNAFMKYLQDNLKNELPTIKSALAKTRYSFGRGENVAKLKITPQRTQKTIK